MEGYLVKLCPDCKKKTHYHPNPMYMHVCEHCGCRCDYGQLIDAVDVIIANREIKRMEEEIEYLKGLLEKYPNM